MVGNMEIVGSTVNQWHWSIKILFLQGGQSSFTGHLSSKLWIRPLLCYQKSELSELQ